MNNQTKFRAKRIDTGEWIEGDLIRNSKGRPCITASWHQSGLKSRFIKVESNTVGQFIGAFAGTYSHPIYKGSIIKVDDFIGVVKYEPQACRWWIHNDGRFIEFGQMTSVFGGEEGIIFEDYEIIGNIHDNPELLK